MSKWFKRILGVVAIAVFSSAAVPSNALIVGTPDTPGNGFPFGSSVGTRYQQAFAASNFSGPVTITGINFFAENTPTNLTRNYTGATYSLSLSTTPLGVNTINEFSNFNANLGVDNQFFVSRTLTGTIDAILNFSGVAFSYDPGQGDLLIDMVISGVASSTSAQFQEDRGNGGIMSKAHDFGAGFDDRGLVTEFLFDENSLISAPPTMVLFGVAFLSSAVFRRRRRTP
jgi:hypothetical protein